MTSKPSGKSWPALGGAGATNVGAVADVAIIGGGFAGALAAIALGGAGRKVTLIERSKAIADVFRAEKIAGDQLPLLSQIGLLDAFKAASTPAKTFINIRGKLVIDRLDNQQYDMPYAKMVELLRARVPSDVAFHPGRVENIETSEDIQRITFANGETSLARLVILATGAPTRCAASLASNACGSIPSQRSAPASRSVRQPQDFDFPRSPLMARRRETMSIISRFSRLARRCAEISSCFRTSVTHGCWR